MAQRTVLEMRVAGAQFEAPGHPRVSLPKVQDLLAKSAVSFCSVDARSSLHEALKAISEGNVGAVVATESGRLAGVVSERDCVRIALADGRPNCATVRDVMARCTASVSVTDSLYDCLHTMNESDAPYLPVVEGGKPVGLITREQVLSELVVYLEHVFHEIQLDQQIVFLRGTYSC